jgi:hypothetical protein
MATLLVSALLRHETDEKKELYGSKGEQRD